MVTAAAFTMSAIALGIVAAMDGGTLMGWAAVITSFAAVITALGTSIASLLRKTSRLESAVGAPNGTSLLKLANETHASAERIEKVDTYLHQRMHDVLNQLGVLVATQPTQIRLIESLIDQLSPKED